jgi:ligand-binding SRPBCC domain-containing protein
MKMYRLSAHQYFPIQPKEAWDFLSSPENLQKITPKHMGFKILSGTQEPMYAGQVIQYTVSPFPGFRTRWVTEITHLEEGSYFVDEQRFGPYSFWHHKHFISAVENGTLMRDIIDYKLPMGPLGNLAQTLFVRRQLTAIFRYREKTLEAAFGRLPGYEAALAIKAI